MRLETPKATRRIATVAQTSGCSSVAGTGAARMNGRLYPMKSGTLLLIERGDRHEIRNTGRGQRRTRNWYLPPPYDRHGDELPAV